MSNQSKGDKPSFDPPYEVDPPKPPRPARPDGEPVRTDRPDPKGQPDTKAGGRAGGSDEEGDADDGDPSSSMDGARPTVGDESALSDASPAKVERHQNTILGPFFDGFIRDAPDAS